MPFPSLAPRARPLGAILLAIVAVALTVAQASAFANTLVSQYTQSNVYNQSNNQIDTTYSPYGGSIWADNFSNHSSVQYIQAENWYMNWNSTNMTRVKASWSQVGPVFHVFNNASGNCASYFDYDGLTESNVSGYRVASKNADCWPNSNGHQNEARIYWNTSALSAGSFYYGGAEFRLGSGDLYIGNTNHVSNDIYFNDGGQKDNVRNGTWCFDGTNGHLWAC